MKVERQVLALTYGHCAEVERGRGYAAACWRRGWFHSRGLHDNRANICTVETWVEVAHVAVGMAGRAARGEANRDVLALSPRERVVGWPDNRERWRVVEKSNRPDQGTF